MNVTTSVHLDFMRLLAALTIFLSHASYGRITGGIPIIKDLKFLGNDGVIIFFVLSGFVISYVAERKETDIFDYVTSRLARLYSVVVPAIILTFTLDCVGSMVAPALYDGWWCQWDNPMWRAVANLLFVNELWFSSVRPFSNGPFWSLGFEFWYYIVFGLAYYMKGWARYFTTGAALLIAGPKIMLLLPVWLLGVLAWRVVRLNTVPEIVGWSLYLGSALAYVLLRMYMIPNLIYAWAGTNLADWFFWTDIPFISDYIIGIFVAMHLIGFSAIAHRFAKPIGSIGVYIRYLAGFTFSLYLYHYPLLQFFAAVTTDVPNSLTRSLIIVLGTLGAVYGLGLVTESKKAECKTVILTIHAGITRMMTRMRLQV